MEALATAREVAESLGVSVRVVREWMRRANDPLPSVVVGSSGRFAKVIAAEVPGWLAAEAERRRGTK